MTQWPRILFPSLVIMTFLGTTHLAEADKKEVSLSMIKAHNTFTVELFKKVAGVQQGNIMLAPYSASEALAIAFTGAHGKTKEQMAQVLGWPLDLQKFSQEMVVLQSHLKTADTIEGIDLNLASGLWVDRSLNLLDTFVKQSKQLFKAPPRSVDFQENTDTSREAINRWVEQKTNAKITDLIPKGSLDSLTRLLLVTATHFKAIWASQFDKSQTQESKFHLSLSDSVNVPFMTQEHQFSYGETKDFQILELPYVENHLSMIFLLPKNGGTLKDLGNIMSRAKLEKWIGSLKTQLVKAYIPRFQFNFRLDLSQTLSSLGMPLAFDSQADFSRISDSEDIHIAAVLHQNFIEVGEEGTEAAGSTGVVMKGRSLRTPQPIVFRADHPFLFMIRENQSGTILFIGRVSEPESTSS